MGARGNMFTTCPSVCACLCAYEEEAFSGHLTVDW